EFNNYFLPKFGHSFLDVVDIISPYQYRFFKQNNSCKFVEIRQPKPTLENMLLIPAEKSDSILEQLGVVED
ncbi:MAG: hypothetical protein ACKPCP_34970, partial [Sphaerospermopsis kisseleviana]